MRVVQLLNIVTTNYDTGPYVITEVDGPCRCPEYVRSLNGDESPSEPHYHLTCRRAEQPERGEYWLDGYRLDGTSVWNNDRLILTGQARGQLELLA